MAAEACKPSNTEEGQHTLSKMNHQQALKRTRCICRICSHGTPKNPTIWGPEAPTDKDIKEAGQWQRKGAGLQRLKGPLAVDGSP